MTYECQRSLLAILSLINLIIISETISQKRWCLSKIRLLIAFMQRYNHCICGICIIRLSLFFSFNLFYSSWAYYTLRTRISLSLIDNLKLLIGKHEFSVLIHWFFTRDFGRILSWQLIYSWVRIVLKSVFRSLPSYRFHQLSYRGVKSNCCCFRPLNELSRSEFIYWRITFALTNNELCI